MEISVTLEEGIAVVSPSGNIVATTAGALSGKIVELISAGVTYILLDLINTAFMDSQGIMVCMSINRMLQERGGMLVCSTPSKAVDKVFHITQIDQKLTIAPTRMEGINAIRNMIKKRAGKE